MKIKNKINAVLNRKEGFTLIEILIVVAILGVLGAGGVVFFQNTFTVWSHTRNLSKAVGDSRLAINEISAYMREASPQSVSTQTAGVYFDIARSEEEWPGDKRIGYFRDGDMLRRYMKGSTSTLVESGVNSFEVWYVEADPDASTYSHIIASISVRQGDIMNDLSLSKRIMLRGERARDE